MEKHLQNVAAHKSVSLFYNRKYLAMVVLGMLGPWQLIVLAGVLVGAILLVVLLLTRKK